MFEIKQAFSSAPGSRETLGLVAGELPTGAPYVIPIMVATGAEPGPTLLVHTGMHGDEVLGTEIVRETWRRVSGTTLRGRLIMVPSSNLPAMAIRSRTNQTEIYPGPQDLNRVFPGDAQGSLTERVAHVITERLVTECDYCLDIHTPSVGGEWQPYASAPAPGTHEEIRDRSHAFAAAFGTTVIYAGSQFPGTIQETAHALGKTATTVELGEANRFDVDLLHWGVQGVLNLLAHTGITDDDPVVPESVLTFTTLHRVRANRGGFLHLAVRPGDDVSAGQRLASIVDVLSEELEAITAPSAGRVVRVNNNALAGTGDIVAYIGTS